MVRSGNGNQIANVVYVRYSTQRLARMALWLIISCWWKLHVDSIAVHSYACVISK